MARKKKASKKIQEEVVIKEYFFAFEIIKMYPYTRSYVLKAPLKKSFKDTISELFVGRI
ncbi:hypothetical protein KKE92_00105 [Candidatus Micrarchaeota archaeon]|nr:hypothetical protein [Candidatus Micrarchaeota archaeon]MBU1681974.1 hypothetical protein [Candidatus Micrarchaeota archaeon]